MLVQKSKLVINKTQSQGFLGGFVCTILYSIYTAYGVMYSQIINAKIQNGKRCFYFYFTDKLTLRQRSNKEIKFQIRYKGLQYKG